MTRELKLSLRSLSPAFLLISTGFLAVVSLPIRDKRAFSYIANQTVCVVDDVIYRDGNPIPTDDPCESCKCRPPGFSCILRECERKPGCKAIRREGECCPLYQCGCEHNGQFYNDGDRIPNAESPCYSCYCQGSSITCALADCKFRFDCEPQYVPKECCPRYDHCPPEPTIATTKLTTLVSTLLSTLPSTTPAITTTIPKTETTTGKPLTSPIVTETTFPTSTKTPSTTQQITTTTRTPTVDLETEHTITTSTPMTTTSTEPQTHASTLTTSSPLISSTQAQLPTTDGPSNDSQSDKPSTMGTSLPPTTEDGREIVSTPAPLSNQYPKPNTTLPPPPLIEEITVTQGPQENKTPSIMEVAEDTATKSAINEEIDLPTLSPVISSHANKEEITITSSENVPEDAEHNLKNDAEIESSNTEPTTSATMTTITDESVSDQVTTLLPQLSMEKGIVSRQSAPYDLRAPPSPGAVSETGTMQSSNPDGDELKPVEIIESVDNEEVSNDSSMIRNGSRRATGKRWNSPPAKTVDSSAELGAILGLGTDVTEVTTDADTVTATEATINTDSTLFTSTEASTLDEKLGNPT